MAVVSQYQFAKMSNVSAAAVNKAVGKSIVMRPDGKIDTDNPINQQYMNKKSRPSGEKGVRTVKSQQVQQPVIPVQMPINRAPAGPRDDSDLMTLDKDRLDELKIIQQIEKEKIKNEQMRGELISREVVEKVFSVLYSIDLNEFLQRSASLSVKIAQEVFESKDSNKILEVQKMIDDDGYRYLNHVQRVFNQALEDIESEERVSSPEDGKNGID